MVDPVEFGNLLSKAIRYIGIEEDKNLSIIQDELGYALGRKGGSVIEYWRKGNLPPTEEDVEILAREIIKRGGDNLGRDWLEMFLRSADYRELNELTNELFPIKQSQTGSVKQVAKKGEDAAEKTIDAVTSTTSDQVPSVEVHNSHRRLNWVFPAIFLIIVVVSGILIINNPSDPIILATSTPSATSIAAVVIAPTDTIMPVSNPAATSTLPPTSNSSATLIATPSIAPTPIIPLCGEATLVEEVPGEENLLGFQGVNVFDTINTPGGILNNGIRTLTFGPKGLLIGYNLGGSTEIGGLTYLEFAERKWFWANCNSAGVPEDKVINSIAVDQNENIWIATDGGGALLYNGSEWTTFTADTSNLPDDRVFDIFIDSDNTVWAATWKGIARFDGAKWTSVYDTADELTRNPAHSIAFDSANNIWIGHIQDGVSRFDAANGVWILYQEGEGTIGGNKIRGIVFREANETRPESVWFATDGGGVTKYEEGLWTVYGVEDGLPSNKVRAIALDFHGRIWAGTVEGTAYFDGEDWHMYHSMSTLSITFAPGCDHPTPCINDHVWTATEYFGLTHSRLPYPDQVLDVKRVCFVFDNGDFECPELIEVQYPHVITATLSQPLTPGEEFYFEVEASLRGGFELNGSKDFLLHVGETEDSLFGSHFNVPVDGIISPGQFFKFSLNDRRMTAPELPDGVDEETFVSPWRTWMSTRLAGPELHIEFTVRQQE